jgi:hypothetical protein
MKNFSILVVITVLLASCTQSIRLSIPERFKSQAEMMEVKGAHKRHMSFGAYQTSKIKRGMNMKSSRYGRGYFLENLFLNQMHIQKDQIVDKQKDKMHFSISDGSIAAEVYAKEIEISNSIRYKLGNGVGFMKSIDRLQEYQYVFSGTITTDTLLEKNEWGLIMTNAYDREDHPNSVFAIIGQGDNGFATNGADTIYIRALTVRKTETESGKAGRLPIKLLTGYELSTSDGVIAIIDGVGKDIWVYNELDKYTRLIVSGISTAVFARRVKGMWQ